MAEICDLEVMILNCNAHCRDNKYNIFVWQTVSTHQWLSSLKYIPMTIATVPTSKLLAL